MNRDTPTDKDTKPKNPCPYHPEVELERKGRANWYCLKFKRSVMLELVYIYQAMEKTK
jgi:hypothetical protein